MHALFKGLLRSRVSIVALALAIWSDWTFGDVPTI